MLKFVLESLLHTDVTELESEEKALTFLKNLSAAPSLIIYDYSPHAYLLEDFIAHLQKNLKSVRIIVLADKVTEEARGLLKAQEQVRLISESSLPMELIEDAKNIFEKNGQFKNEDEYCRMDINFLSILDGINKNLFIKIGQNKFIKVFNEDDNTNLLDLKKYQEKGITYLYVKRETALWITSQIQSQIHIFLKANNFRFILRGASESAEKKFEQKILRLDDEVHIDTEFRDTINKAIERIRQIVEKEPKVENLLKTLKNNQDKYAFFTQKMNLTSVIACCLSKELEWHSKNTLDKLVYASVVSDITLAVRPELLEIPNYQQFLLVKDKFTEDERKFYLSHPADSANLIRRYFTSAPPDTDDLAYQQHEQPDGNGFPRGLKAEKISPLGALFIVATDFSYYFLKDSDPSMEDFILKAQSKYDYVNFRKVVKALEKLKKK
ncbi:MAG: HD-GYP domain-containing protein [Bacteriovoracaceae bacterium]